jgi:YihY family inner membrane protein
MSTIGGAVDRTIDAIDGFQRRFRLTALAVAVFKRYGDDRGGRESALITFYGMLSVFPLLLLLITFASKILGPHSDATKRIINSALEQFPVIGTRLADNIHALATGSWFTLVGSTLFLLWGALGITSALQLASMTMWRQPRHKEPNILMRSWRGLRLLGVLTASVVLVSIFTGISASGILHRHSTLLAFAALIVEAGINLGAYLLALKILAPNEVPWRSLIPGMLFGGLGWTILQQAGGYLISHQLQRTSEIYGFFAIVIGLIFWLNIGAQLFLLATEVNVVLAEGSWPRGLREPSPQVKTELAMAAHDPAEASEN